MQAIKKSLSTIGNVGGGSSFAEFELIKTDVGERSNIGAPTIIKAEQTTGNIVNVGDLVKYVNVCVEVGPRFVENPDEQNQQNGWFEWAIVKSKEAAFALPFNSNLGVSTVGDICTQVYRGDCIMSGCLPVGANQPNAQDIVCKIPKIFQKMQQGSVLHFIFYFRNTDVADLRTDSHRFVISTIYKTYT